MANDRLWILGASDPEMVAIERLLTEAGERWFYAVAPAGSGHARVHPARGFAGAYRAREAE